MFWHNFKYNVRTLFKNKTLIFWTFAFPIILGTLFYMAFSNIENSEKLDIIPIAIINNEDFQKNEPFKNAFKTLSDEKNEDRLFDTKIVDLEEAEKLLNDNNIVGYLTIENGKEILTFKENGIEETIFKYVVENISETVKIKSDLIKEEIENQYHLGNIMIDYQEIYVHVDHLIAENTNNIDDLSKTNMSYTMIEFYTLIAMTCLYGGMLSMVAINQSLANMSNKGKRIAISPTKKSTIIISSLLASYLVQLIGLALLFLYTIFVLKVDYGTHTFLVILLAAVGSLAGLSLGLFVGALFKVSEDTKTGILIAFTMLGSFLSGMMGITMKYIIDTNAPIVNKLNPASMITDGLYSLYYYETMNRFWLNMVSLLLFSLILIFIAFLSLRRQKYEHI